MISSLVVTAQTKHSGKVIGSDDKQPVTGASVRIKGTNLGTVTDVNGEFNLTLAPGNVLVVSYLTYQTKEVTVQDGQYLTISLQPANTTLNEVVVTGYTSQRKKDISGSVSTVDVSVAKSIPASSAENLLQGQASGVTVVTQGSPGATGQVFIRGISNFGNSQPLYVVDGLQTGSISNLNVNDIESISVLKDAGAAAIYGVSGGNGVVVVTTKKGKQGKSVLTYDGYYGTTQPLGGNVFNLLNADEFGQLVNKVNPADGLLINGKIGDYGYQGGGNKGVANAGDPAVAAAKYHLDKAEPSADYLIQKFVKGAGTDWYHTLYRAAPTQQHSLSASGASDKNAYFLSIGYTNQQGTLVDSYFKRIQGRVNTTFNIKDHFRIGESVNVYYDQSPNGAGQLPGGGNQNEGNSVSEIYRIEPQIPVYDIAGNYGGTYAGPTTLGNALNPLAQQQRQETAFNKVWGMQGTGFAEADFLKYFTARTAISTDINNNYYYNIAYRPYDSGEGHGNANGYNEGSSYNTSYNWSNTATYGQVFGKHNIKFLGGFEAKSYSGRFINSSTHNLFSLDPYYASISKGDPKSTTSSSGYQTNGQGLNKTLSLFARLDYVYNDKYILGATVRRDGSSLFYTGQQWGTFPSVSLAWRISQEAFMKNISWIQDLKLRGSYGVSGYNGNVNAKNPFTTFGSDAGGSYYPIDGSSSAAFAGYFANQTGNHKTTWESDKVANFGFDASLFNHLDITLEYYKKNVTNLLFPVQLAGTVGGAGVPVVNIGAVQNKGFDFNATYHGAAGDLRFNIGGNITSYKNTITKLDASFQTDGLRNGNVVQNAVGHSIGEFYGYKVQGYWNTQGEIDAENAKQPVDQFGSRGSYQKDALPGRFRYADTNGDGKITDADRVYFGNPNPDFTYGLNLNAVYKGFDFTAIFYGSHGNSDFNYVKYWTNFFGSLTGNKSRDLLYNSWSPTNTAAQNAKAKTPILETGGSDATANVINSYYVESGAFLKCRSVQLGYTFAPNSLKSLGVDKLHVYVQAVNLFTITKYTGQDPELQATTQNGLGVDQGNYPNNERKFIFGVNMSF
jgi:TonB-linked SusC/RagA family outer membrane protein